MQMDWLKKWANTSPYKRAVKCLDTNADYTYRELFLASCRMAAKLKSSHINSGDRIAILAQNRIEHILLFFACQRIGAIFVPLNFRLSTRECVAVISDSQPKILFSDVLEVNEALSATQIKIEGVSEILSGTKFNSAYEGFDVTPSEPSLMLYTSGTTGAAKGVLISENAMFWNATNTALRLGLTFETNHLCFHPFFHASGWNVLTIPTLRYGGSVYLLSKFEPADVLHYLSELKISILFGVPTMLDRMSKLPEFPNANLSSVRFAVVGGEPMPLDAIRLWHSREVPVRQGFGLTEFGTNVFSLNAEDAERKLGSIGTPNFYMDVRVVDDAGSKCGPDSIGELQLRGPVVMNGYWNKPEETKASFTDGWLKTGDLVKYDSEGFFFVSGRKKDMYISGGENVYPAEVELLLREHENVLEAAVIGIPDKQWGEVGLAFVVLKAPTDIETLKEFCRKQIAKYKVPKEFRFVSELPKSESGKILKKALKL